MTKGEYLIMKKLSRAQAWDLLTTYVDEDSLLEHSLIVETIMRYYAKLNNEDPDVWGVTGLLHDMDWQKFPEEEHCHKTAEILREQVADEVYIRAILSHDCHCTNVYPKTPMEKTLYAIDELSGIILADIKIRPSKSVLDLKPKSVKKKFKEKSFARNVDRDAIKEGIEWLGSDLNTVIKNCIAAMQGNAEALGLVDNVKQD